MRTFMLSTVAAAALLLSAADVSALEGRGLLGGGSEFSGKTIWTDKADLTEIARFPLRSKNPSFIIYLESLHPDPACTEDRVWNGECSDTLCEIYVDVRDDLQPVRNIPIQPDPSTVVIAGNSLSGRVANGAHMTDHLDFGLFVEAFNGEALWFHGPIILIYADGNQQCMAGVRVEYTHEVKNLFNKWRP